MIARLASGAALVGFVALGVLVPASLLVWAWGVLRLADAGFGQLGLLWACVWSAAWQIVGLSYLVARR